MLDCNFPCYASTPSGYLLCGNTLFTVLSAGVWRECHLAAMHSIRWPCSLRVQRTHARTHTHKAVMNFSIPSAQLNYFQARVLTVSYLLLVHWCRKKRIIKSIFSFFLNKLCNTYSTIGNKQPLNPPLIFHAFPVNSQLQHHSSQKLLM